MSDQKNLFSFVKGLLRSPAGAAASAAAAGPARRPARVTPPPRRVKETENPDNLNPSTIVRVGKTNDGRDLVMTLGLGTFVLDREAPSIGYYHQGQVLMVPTSELARAQGELFAKQNVGAYAAQYVDLLNVVTYELEARTATTPRTRLAAKSPAPVTAAMPPSAPPSPGSDKDNPATITRVGRSHHGGTLVMTQGLGTFLLHRESGEVRYFNQGQEWEVPETELQLLLDALMGKQVMNEHRYAYIDLLNAATLTLEKRGKRRRLT